MRQRTMLTERHRGRVGCRVKLGASSSPDDLFGLLESWSKEAEISSSICIYDSSQARDCELGILATEMMPRDRANQFFRRESAWMLIP